MTLQQGSSLEKNEAKVGTTIQAMVDDYGDFLGEIVRRSNRDAPGIDGTVKIGDIVEVKIQSAGVYSLSGEVIAQVL